MLRGEKVIAITAFAQITVSIKIEGFISKVKIISIYVER